MTEMVYKTHLAIESFFPEHTKTTTLLFPNKGHMRYLWLNSHKNLIFLWYFIRLCFCTSILFQCSCYTAMIQGEPILTWHQETSNHAVWPFGLKINEISMLEKNTKNVMRSILTSIFTVWLHSSTLISIYFHLLATRMWS